MNSRLTAFGLLVLAGLPEILTADDSVCTIERCLVKLIDQNDVLISVPEAGIVKELPFAQGATIQEGDVVLKLEDKDAQLRMEAAQKELERAKVEANSTAEIDAADAAWKVAIAEDEDNKALNKRAAGAVTVNELRRGELTAKRAGFQKIVAEHDHQVAMYTAQSTAAQAAVAVHDFEKRSIKAPIAGRIEELMGKRGQWVQQGEPIMRVVQMDTLKVEGFLSADSYSREQVMGQPVTVVVGLAHGRQHEFTGVIKFVGQLIDADGKYQIWAEVTNQAVSNQWMLHPGRRATMTIAIRPPGQFSTIPGQRPIGMERQIVRKPVTEVTPAAAEAPAGPQPTKEGGDDVSFKDFLERLEVDSSANRSVPRKQVAPRQRFRL